MREEAAATEDPVIDTPRFRWRVRDCVFCSWRELREEYSAAEMWQLLIQGRFTKAVTSAITVTPPATLSSRWTSVKRIARRSPRRREAAAPGVVAVAASVPVRGALQAIPTLLRAPSLTYKRRAH